MELIFVYGTLQDPKIQQQLLGRVLNGQPDSVSGFEMTTIYLEDGAFPILIPATKSNPLINGHTLKITNTELIQFDAYETKAYQRSLIKLISGNKAWIYHK